MFRKNNVIKKVILLLLICSNLTAIETNYIGVVSFNSLHLGWENKNYKEIAKVLSKFDLIGLQEVMNEGGLQKTISELEKQSNEEWTYHISERSAGTGKYQEFYGYIWKKDSINLKYYTGFYPEKNLNDFIREPYGATFSVNDYDYDFTFVLCHLIFGKSKRQRRAEASRLPKVYNYFQSASMDDQDIIIAGDFNLPGSDKGFKKLLSHPDKIRYTIPSTAKTTISNKKLVSSYDNFFISKYSYEEVITSQVYYYSDNYNIIKKSVSDHMPIILFIDVRFDND